MLKEKYSSELIKESLLSKDSFKPFPSLEDATWKNLPSEVKEHYLKRANDLFETDWGSLPVTRYMDYTRNGNRSKFEDIFFGRRDKLLTLLMGEIFENKGRFLDDIINGIWCICEETTWVDSAHNINPEGGKKELLPDFRKAYPHIDLFSAETASALCWTYYFLKNKLDEISPLICERIKFEIKKRIIEPYYHKTNFWWMGYSISDEYKKNRKLNNWNPWINSNCLLIFLLLEDDSERRLELVNKCIDSIDKFIDGYDEDGGCDEGPGYWSGAGAALFDFLDLLFEASSGKINIYNENKIKNIGRYIYRVYIGKSYFANFADGGSKIKLGSEFVYRMGKRIGDKMLSDFGLMQKNSFSLNTWFLYRGIKSIQNFKPIKKAEIKLNLANNVWLEDLQVMTARPAHDETGLFVAAKGGHNNESHNHNDVGNYIVYSDSMPVIIDVGVETYTSKTFSPRRYEIWTMQSQYHNLPTINGIQQEKGAIHCATNVNCIQNENVSELSLNISKAYPENSGIEKWNRTYKYVRGNNVTLHILDDFSLASPTKDIFLTLMTPCEHELSELGKVTFSPEGGKKVQLTYDKDMFEVVSEYIKVEDDRLLSQWGDHVYRLKFIVRKPASEGHLEMVFQQV